jgi:heptosyltransferase-1
MLPERILVIRLSAMGDILHALPAVATLRRSFPGCRISWAVKPRFRELLDGGGLADEVIPIDRGSYAGVRESARRLRSAPFDLAIDFQGLVQSALVATVSGASRIIGFDAAQVRERPATLFYSSAVSTRSAHVVDMNLELAAAAGARQIAIEFPLPPGRPEGDLPAGPFVLAAPIAGWASKQWPLENYSAVAARLKRELGVTLVLNGSPAQQARLRQVAGAQIHLSTISGLIDATRRCAATLGVDSGPMHLGAALGRPGVAVFGPTDPVRNGPYSALVCVLRSPLARNSYKRGADIDASMRATGPDEVFEALKAVL